MEIKNFIKIYDEVIPFKVLSNLIRNINTFNFTQAEVGGGDVRMLNTSIRKTLSFALTNLSNSLTEVHWYNLLYRLFFTKILDYQKSLNIIDFPIQNIDNIEILKYENTGFYTWHTDHFAEYPRTMSCILLLNNDYEGGNLYFRNPDGSGEWEVEVKPNRMIIWPSNFLYPHTVKPVTKGTRYSIVAWAL